MTSFLILTGVFSVAISIILIRKYKFYKVDVSDMQFATKLRVFVLALVLGLFGVAMVVSQLVKLFK